MSVTLYVVFFLEGRLYFHVIKHFPLKGSVLCQSEAFLAPILCLFVLLILRIIFFWLCWVFFAAHGLSLVLVSRGCTLVVAHGLRICSSRALEQRLNSWCTRAWLLCGIWDLPRSGIEPASPALAGGFLIPEPPG